MARWEFKLPDIGEGVTEGEVVSWLVQAGDTVREDQPMVEVMTDKATVTITSPKGGRIVELAGKVGQIVKVHSTLVVYELDNGGSATSGPAGTAQGKGAATSEGPAATAVGDIKEDLPGMSLMRSGTREAAPPMTEAPVAVYFADKPLATPATRKLARDLEIDLKRVPPTGPGGRVTKDDVARFGLGAAAVAHQGQAAALVATPKPAEVASASTLKPPSREPVKIARATGPEVALETRTPFVGIRRKIAERMQRSKNTAAHFTFVEECDCTELRAVRERLKPMAEAQGVKLTYLAFIAKAVVSALVRHPSLNSALDESANELVTRRYVHLGIAASTDAGLVVPVVRDADRMSILELASEIERLGRAAKEGTLKPGELTGSTITITSLGAQGGLFATPIINFPEVAILGVHQMKEKPVVKDGAIVVGHVMLLSLSFDHRIIDGHVGAAFAYEVIDFLQRPDRLLLEG